MKMKIKRLDIIDVGQVKIKIDRKSQYFRRSETSKHDNKALTTSIDTSISVREFVKNGINNKKLFLFNIMGKDGIKNPIAENVMIKIKYKKLCGLIGIGID